LPPLRAERRGERVSQPVRSADSLAVDLRFNPFQRGGSSHFALQSLQRSALPCRNR